VVPFHGDYFGDDDNVVSNVLKSLVPNNRKKVMKKYIRKVRNS
jgi:hypothetical protein